MGRKKKKTIEIIIERCMGCRSCELACAVAHSESKDLQEAIKAEERPGYRINVEAYGNKAIPIHCNHCEEAACIMACPTGALHRESDGAPVLLDDEKCIGCKMCVQACPFGVITVGPDGKGVLKCDQCIERLAKGAEPACVSACPTKALLFVDSDEAARSKRRKTAEKLVLAQENGENA